MTVRWKPLLVLSGLFVVIAVVGVVAIASKLLPRGAADILPSARAERAARQFERANVHHSKFHFTPGIRPEKDVRRRWGG